MRRVWACTPQHPPATRSARGRTSCTHLPAPRASAADRGITMHSCRAAARRILMHSAHSHVYTAQGAPTSARGFRQPGRARSRGPRAHPAPRRARRGCPRAGFISCARSPSPASPSSSASSTCRAPIRTWARWWVASPSMAAPSSTTRNGAPPHAAVSAATPWIQLLPLGCHGLGAVLHPVPWEPAAVSVLSLCSVWFASVISLSGCSPPFHPCPISAVSARHFYSHRC
ncbi:hypothetical protein IEO21_08083 [Rhodonia placenta]|uniref:Uncharacterized protein n=1 Tax=Rhodonia placenta TaxID=104341 RepID=A0A8H7TZJ9_9APHY|nr:hypothetical protein IEO21_08083 [Postia placenta]